MFVNMKKFDFYRINLLWSNLFISKYKNMDVYSQYISDIKQNISVQNLDFIKYFAKYSVWLILSGIYVNKIFPSQKKKSNVNNTNSSEPKEFVAEGNISNPNDLSEIIKNFNKSTDRQEFNQPKNTIDCTSRSFKMDMDLVETKARHNARLNMNNSN